MKQFGKSQAGFQTGFELGDVVVECRFGDRTGPGDVENRFWPLALPVAAGCRTGRFVSLTRPA
jgi:hypothetical protein